MKHDHIEFRGSYRYASMDALDHALASAREYLDDDELGDLDQEWARFFVRRGTTLQIEAMLPVVADRYVAAAVLDTLARTAIEGFVEARRGAQRLDLFPSGY